MKKFYINNEEVEQRVFNEEIEEAINNETFSENEEENWALQDQAIDNTIGYSGSYKFTISGKTFEVK